MDGPHRKALDIAPIKKQWLPGSWHLKVMSTIDKTMKVIMSGAYKSRKKSQRV
jgi:hypothetical protein